MKKPLTAVLLTAAAVATLAVPAGAAVPKRPATQTIPCDDGSGKSAQVWQKPGQLAAKNPCSQWLELDYGTMYAGGATDHAYAVAPGSHFNWGKSRAVSVRVAWLTTSTPDDGGFCGGEPSYQLVYSYKDVGQPPGC